MKLNDAILGLAILLGGLAITVEARTFKPTHGQTFGPDLFPTIIGVGLMLAGIWLVATGWRARHATGWISMGGAQPGRIIDAGLVLGAIVAFILVTPWLGFVLSATLMTGLLIVRFRAGHWLSSFVIAILTALICDWAFRKLLLVPLPLGSVLPRLPW